MSRYPRNVVCRGDKRGIVHYTLRPTLNDPAGGSAPDTPALCEQFVDQLLVMTMGPLENYPTCLWCITSEKGWR